MSCITARYKTQFRLPNSLPLWLHDSLWDTVGSVESVSEKSDDEADTATAETEADVASLGTSEPEAEKAEDTTDATNIDRTLLMFQNSHLFELDWTWNEDKVS